MGNVEMKGRVCVKVKGLILEVGVSKGFLIV